MPMKRQSRQVASKFQRAPPGSREFKVLRYCYCYATELQSSAADKREVMHHSMRWYVRAGHKAHGRQKVPLPPPPLKPSKCSNWWR